MRNKDVSSDSDSDNDGDDDSDRDHHHRQELPIEQQPCGVVVYLNNAHQARLDPTVQLVGVSNIAKEPWEMNPSAVVADCSIDWRRGRGYCYHAKYRLCCDSGGT
jgi:hypothetical protein